MTLKTLRGLLDGALWMVAGMIFTGALPAAVMANPQGGSVAAGTATIQQSGSRVDVHQASDRAVIDWRSFSIAPGEVTQFHQPSAASVALNRVTGADPSHIFGSLSANGQVILVNPNGILFGVGSRVDVSGLVATTSDIRNHDFMAGRLEFSVPSTDPRAAVVNEGRITIAEAGHAALVAPHVRNSGIIDARLGRVTLGAVDSFAVDLYGDDLVAFRVGVRRTPVGADSQPVDALVANDGRILAGGGIVRLAADNVEAVVRNVINTDGVIYANAIERRGGTIIIKAAGAGDVAAAGEISAADGTVEISGDENVTLTNAAVTAARVSVEGDADRSGAGDLNGGPTGGDVVVSDSAITAKDGDRGGRVAITADRVALTGATAIDAAGTRGGGEVLIGGDFQGKGALRNADATIVGALATISADAGEVDDGGRVILWADGYTRFHGDISATGGTTAGDGGFVEVSGKQNLDFNGAVDLTAPSGATGTLLLDPVNIVVSNASNFEGASGGTILFADFTVLEPWNVSPAALDAVGGDILLQASNDITFTDAVNLTTAGATLTATANNDINVDDNLTTNNAAITLTADADGSGTGDLTVAATKSVTSGNAAISATGNDFNLGGSLNSGAGDVTIFASDGGTIGLGATSGNFTVSGTELQNITAANLIIGDATNKDITVDGITAAESNNIAGTVTLNASKSSEKVIFANTASTFNSLIVNAGDDVRVDSSLAADLGGLTLNAGKNVEINEDVTTAGVTTINADSDNDGSGTFAVDTAKTLDTNNNTLSITANDIDLSGVLNSGAASITLLVSDGGTIKLGDGGGNFKITGTELQNITATSLTIGDGTNGDITVDNITAANSNNIAGMITLNATGAGAAITFENDASTFNSLTVNANTAITTDIALTTDTGALTLNAGTGITFNENVSSAGPTKINADSDNNGVGDFTVAATKTLNTANNTLSITTNDLVLNGSLNSGTGATSLLVSDGGTIGLGATAGNMTIAGAELQNITATGLTIGDGTSGNITVNGISAANSNNIIGTVTLNATGAGRSIAFSGGSSTFNALTANANTTISAAAGVQLTTDMGALSLSAGGGVTLNENITTAGAVTIDADSDNNGIGDFTVAAAKTLNTTNNTLSVTANDLVLSGSLNSGTAATTLLVSDGGTIGLGAAAGDMSISGAELQNITATGLTIGDATNGNVTVNGVSAANSNNIAGTTTLNATGAGRSVTFSGGASTFNALSARADDQIAVKVDVTTDTGGLALDGDADNAADTNDNLVFTGGRSLTSAGGISLDATTGGISGAGTLTLNANNGVTFSAAFTGTGATIVNGNTDGDGAGAVTATTINLGANALTMSGVSVNTGTSLMAGAVTLNGAVAGSGLTVASLTLTGASAVMINTTVNGKTGEDAAAETDMPDALTHLVNGCIKSGCAASPLNNIDAIVNVSDPDVSSDPVASDSSGGADSFGEASADSSAGAGGDTGGDTGSGGGSSSDSSSARGDGGATSGGWAGASFNAAAGDAVLTDSAATLRAFFESLTEEGANNLDLLEAADDLRNPEIASLVSALGEILGEYAFISASVPTNAFNDKAQTLLPGLLTFEPAAGDGIAIRSGRREYRPPSLGRFQF